MDLKNVENAHYLQINKEVKRLVIEEGLKIIPSSVAWEKLNYTRKYFKKKPKEGFFVIVEKNLPFPLFLCVLADKKKIVQDLRNVLIVRKNVKLTVNSFCFTKGRDLSVKHIVYGKVIVGENSNVIYNQFHGWGKNDFVKTQYDFVLKRGAYLKYNYKSFSTPKNLIIQNKNYTASNSSVDSETIIDAKNTSISIDETLFLKGDNSNGLIKLRIVAREKSQIKAISEIEAEKPSKGHLDCQGLLISNNSSIDLVPRLDCKNKDAQLTHEASIGKISEEELFYLQTRGLSEKEAIDFIITGFLTN